MPFLRVRSAPMHFSRNEVVWTTMKERIEMFRAAQRADSVESKELFVHSALAILIDFFAKCLSLSVKRIKELNE